MSIFLNTKDWAFKLHSVVLTSIWLRRPAYGLEQGIEKTAHRKPHDIVQKPHNSDWARTKSSWKSFRSFPKLQKIAAITLMLSPYHGQSRTSRLITEPSEL